MILALELAGAYLAGAVSLLVVLARYGGRIVQYVLQRKIRAAFATAQAKHDPDNWLAPKP